MSKALRVSVVCVSIIGEFSLSELVFYGSLKILDVNSRSPETCIHAPESEEDPESCTLHSEMASTIFIGSLVMCWACFYHGLYFSVLFSQSSVKVCFPHFVFILSTTIMASLGISLIRKPASKSQFVFNLLATVAKIK